MFANPAPDFFDGAARSRFDGLASQKTLQVVGQFAGALVALARFLSANAGVSHPSRLRTKLSATSDWKRSGWTCEAMATTAAEGRGT